MTDTALREVDARLLAVRRTGLLDAPPEESFDRLTALARRLTGAPLAFMTVVDDVRSYWLSAQGLAPGTPTQNTYDESFCQYVLDGEALVLGDVTTDERTRANPSIDAMGVRAWAGFPVRTPDGQVLGSFCVVDTEVHPWTADDVALLEDLAAIASREVALRAATEAAEAARAAARAEADRAGLLARIGDMLAPGLDPAGVWQAIATLTVPAVGDFAYVLTVEPDGRLLPVAARHRDPAGLRYLWDWIHTAPRRVGEAAGAGLVALTGQLQLLDTPLNPGLTDAQLAATAALDVQSSLVVPIKARGQVAAVITIGRTTSSPRYSESDRSLVAALADRAGLVVGNALAYRAERDVSETMQRALLRVELPAQAELPLAVRYRPAGQAQLVGGDWYDAFVDAGGSTTLVIGDVAGHDIEAATTMGQLRTMVRMAGYDGSREPSEILAAVDAACDTFAQQVFATAVVARVRRAEDGGWRVRWSSAGHPAPLLLSQDGTVTVLRRRPGLPLGVAVDAPRADHEAVLAAGDTLLMHTDGLIEARDMDLDTGLARLVGVLASVGGLDLQRVCDQVVETLLPEGGADDDVALIAVRPR